MDSETTPKLVIQLQAQTSTAHLSSNEFDAKTELAAGRINALLKARSDASKNAGQMGFIAAKALAGELPHGYIAAGPQNANRTLVAHPGELVPLQLESVLEDDDSDTASDVTERPSYDTESPTQSWSPTSPTSLRQFAIKQEDGSYKDVDIRTMDMREVAPWLYQDTQSSASTYETPPSSLNRASRANNLVRKRLSQTLEGIENTGAMISTPSLTPIKTVTATDRKGSLTSLFTPSPTSGVRKISKKFSLANLRTDSLKSDNSDNSSPLGRSFPSKTEGHDGNSSGSTSTVGCDPYEKQPCGPTPVVPNAELEVDDESPRTGGAETPEEHPTDSTHDTDLRSRRIPEFRPLSVITTALNWDIVPMDQIAQAQDGNKTKKKVLRYKSGQRHVSPDTVTVGSIQSTPSSERSRDVNTSSSTLPTIHGDVATLFSAPPPLLIDHPFFRDDENAFKVKTDYPLMTTSTPAHAIKTFASDMAQLSSKSTGFPDDLRKKRSYRNLGGLIPMSAPPMRMAFGSGLSPAVAAKNAAKARASNDSAPTTPSLTRVAISESEGSRGKSMRKISTLFTRGTKNSSPAMSAPGTDSTNTRITKGRQKSVEEDTASESTLEMWIRKREERMPGMPWKLNKEERFYVEQFVRNHLAYHRKDYKPGKWPHYPHHPNNPNRAWDHENLRCISCIDDYCACCGKVCCAYKAINLRLSLFSKESEENNGMTEMLDGLFPDLDQRDKKSPREATKELKDILDSIRPARDGKIMGGESSTFIQCTECKKMVCPTCCGMCPEHGCSDTLCRKCKGSDPWEPCKWHDKAQV